MKRSQPLLGTFVTITVCGSNVEKLQTGVTAAFGEIRRIDSLLSIHRKESELSRVNLAARTGPVTISSELYSVLKQAQEIAKQTEGAFDVTIRPVADLWGFIWKEHRMPTQEELDRVLPTVDYRHIHLNAADRTVAFGRPDVSIDLGGIGKGYAVDRAIQALQDFGITNALVKAGGDLRVMGNPPGERGWPVQLEDPAKKGERMELILTEGALSTSGDYENFFIVDGRRYSHILDPRTGMPVAGVAACTVTTATCMESDAWATACLVYGVERSLEKFGGRMGIRFSIPDGEKGFKVRQSPAFAFGSDSP